MPSPPRTILLTRIHRIELPFLARFLPHYLDLLGFDHVRFIHASSSDHDWLKDWIRDSGYGERVSVWVPCRFNDANALLDLSVPELARQYDWMVLADMDEYLHLAGRKIGAVLASHAEHRIVHFRWFMVSSMEKVPATAVELLEQASLFRKRFSKSAFQLRDVTRIDAHEAFWEQPLRPDESFIYNIRAPVRESLFYYHFCSRGLFDQVLKSAHQQFGTHNIKSARPDVLRRFLMCEGDVAAVDDVPGRFLLLMLQQQEDQSSQRLVTLARDYGKHVFADYRFDIPLLTEMLTRALTRLDLPPANIDRIIGGDALQTCMQRITERFWIEHMRPDLRLENYLSVLKKWMPGMDAKAGG